MWIINFLPEWAFHLLLILGGLTTIAGFALGMIPIIKKYGLALKVIGVTTLLLALYLEGGLADYKAWELRVKEMEARVAAAEAEAAKKNTEIVEKIVLKQQIVKERGNEVVKYIDKEIVKYDNTCVIPKEFIEAHNKAATGIPK